MDVSESMVHVSQVQHVADIVGAVGGLGRSLTPGVFKQATVTSYGPDGQQKASVGAISFEGVQFAADGSIMGGRIVHSASTPEGKLLSNTTLTLANGGTPTQAQTQIHNRNDDGVEKVLQTDLSSVQWTPGGKISSGEIRLTTQDPATHAQRSSASMVYQGEKPASGAVTSYSASDGKTVESQTELDYSGLTFLGHKVAGGQMNVARKQPDQTVSSRSQVQFAANSFGRIQQVQTTNLDPEGNTRSTATADYSGVTFDARNKISAGDIHISVAAPDQSPMLHSVVTFANSMPSMAQAFSFRNGVLAGKTLTDFSNAKFDNQNRVTGSSLKVDQYDASERLVASTTVNYDANRSVTAKNTTLVPVAAPPAPPRAHQDVINSLPKPITGGAAKPAAAPAVNPPSGSSTLTTKQIKRPDGTLETTVAATVQGGVPISAVVTHYATDGKTVASTVYVDLSKVLTSGQTPSGSASIREFTGGTTLSSESFLEYA
jgi:hypothetical protein